MCGEGEYDRDDLFLGQRRKLDESSGSSQHTLVGIRVTHFLICCASRGFSNMVTVLDHLLSCFFLFSCKAEIYMYKS
jgi:hypothetical protein